MRMRQLAAAACLLALFASSSVGRAQQEGPASDAPQKATTTGETKLLIPSLQLAASSDGSADFKVGFGILFGTSGAWDFVVSPRFQTKTSDGVATLFSSSADSSMPWEVGSVFDAVYLDVPAMNAQVDDMKVTAYDTCAKACASKPDCKFKLDDPISKKTGTTPEKLCEDGQKQYLAAEAELPGLRGRYPGLKISAGGTWGRQKFSYLGGAMDALSTKSEKDDSFRLGLYAGYVGRQELRHDLALTLEVRATGTSSWSSSNATHWCVGSGTVTASGQSVPAQTCKDTPLGAPVNAQAFQTGFDVGVVDKFRGFWRAAVGFTWSEDIQNTTTTVGFEFPIYVSFASGSAPSSYGGKYKGIFRIVPAVEFASDASNKLTPQAVIRLEVLGQDSLFPEALDL